MFQMILVSSATQWGWMVIFSLKTYIVFIGSINSAIIIFLSLGISPINYARYEGSISRFWPDYDIFDEWFAVHQVHESDHGQVKHQVGDVHRDVDSRNVLFICGDENNDTRQIVHNSTKTDNYLWI